MTPRVDITVRFVPGVGWAYRVHLSKEEDWSGSAESMHEAWSKACALFRRLHKGAANDHR